jgi:hypothetical protein
MATVSRKRMEEIENDKRKAAELYESGYSTREVGEMIKKSHEWVRQAVIWARNQVQKKT